MPLNLNELQTLAAQIDVVEIESFAVDLARQEIVIGYSELAAGKRVRTNVLIVSGPDFAASIGRASEIAGANVYAALKTALYEKLTQYTGAAGTVS